MYKVVLCFVLSSLHTVKPLIYGAEFENTQSIKARCQAENEDVVGAEPTSDAPTTSERSNI